MNRVVASQVEFRRAVRHWAELLGFPSPWKLYITFCNAERGDPCDATDPDVYICTEAQPQYHRAEIRIDQRHPGWVREQNTIDQAVRHELFHNFVSLLSQFVFHEIGGDKAKQEQFNDLEDELVNRLASMPVWDSPTGESG